MAALLTLHNPHAVIAALERRPRDVRELRLPRGGAGDAWQRAAEVARAAGVPVRTVERGPDRRERAARERGERRGGLAAADVEPRAPVSLAEAFAEPRPGDRWLALDQVQDPQNVGSIFRSAAFFGVRAVLVPADRSAPLSAAVYDTASGGVELVPHVDAGNLRRALDAARAAGVWVLGTDERAERAAHAIDRDRPWLLVLGNEERGLRRLTREACDEVCRLEPRGELGTLNVAVATAVLLAVVDPLGPPAGGSSGGPL